jgi:nucleotide-binding universal stress UspA family protein
MIERAPSASYILPSRTQAETESIMIKDIVVNLSVEGSAAATGFAVSVASALKAHLAGIAFAFEPIIPATDMGGIPVELIESQRTENEGNAQSAIAKFEEAARREGLSAESRMVDASLAGASEVFGRLARHFDLSIVGQAEPDKATAEDMIIEGALFDAGRPVLVVPYVQKTGLKLDHVMVCWDGSRNAARAVSDAMPFLERAKVIEVVTIVDEPDKGDEFPGADIAQHLARHGLKIDVRRVAKGDVDVANNILSLAADSETDFIVMGGYGHSRFREFIFGGATRGILASMTVPTLMSH